MNLKVGSGAIYMNGAKYGKIVPRNILMAYIVFVNHVQKQYHIIKVNIL